MKSKKSPPKLKPAAGSPLTNLNLAESAYERLKSDIFDFRLLPGERFSQNDVAGRYGMSRTPVREALLRLEREGFIRVSARSGWTVNPLDFDQFDQLYEVRTILEIAAVKHLCECEQPKGLDALKEIWLVKPEQRLSDWKLVARLDEAFHEALINATGNREMMRIYRDVAERMRIIRRLDFTKPARISDTYEEHAKILKAILLRKTDYAQMLLRSHIAQSAAEVRKITLHMLHTARVHLQHDNDNESA